MRRVSDSHFNEMARFNTAENLWLYSIVFVHGLQGHPYKTWASKPAKERKLSDVDVVQIENDGPLRNKQRKPSVCGYLHRPLPIRPRLSRIFCSWCSAGKGIRSNKKPVSSALGWSESPCTTVTGLDKKVELAPSVSDANVFWPAEFLAAECPDARILT
jgi:hypothetical protein